MTRLLSILASLCLLLRCAGFKEEGTSLARPRLPLLAPLAWPEGWCWATAQPRGERLSPHRGHCAPRQGHQEHASLCLAPDRAASGQFLGPMLCHETLTTEQTDSGMVGQGRGWTDDP